MDLDSDDQEDTPQKWSYNSHQRSRQRGDQVLSTQKIGFPWFIKQISTSYYQMIMGLNAQQLIAVQKGNHTSDSNARKTGDLPENVRKTPKKTKRHDSWSQSENLLSRRPVSTLAIGEGIEPQDKVWLTAIKQSKHREVFPSDQKAPTPININLSKSDCNTCSICFSNPPDSVFADCGHGGLCFECAASILKASKECHLCRKAITQYVTLDKKHDENHDEFIRIQSETILRVKYIKN